MLDILKPGGEDFWEVIYLAAVLFLYIGMAYRLSLCSAGIEVYKEYLDKYNEVVAVIQARQHKFMNQINAIYVLFELYDNYEDLVAKQKEEIENLKQYIMPDTMMVLGRPLVIAHIYKKMCEAENMGIVMKTQFSCSLKDINIPDIYLIEIIGNLIDNAIYWTDVRWDGIKDSQKKLYINIDKIMIRRKAMIQIKPVSDLRNKFLDIEKL